jgi:hypothetical protein
MEKGQRLESHSQLEMSPQENPQLWSDASSLCNACFWGLLLLLQYYLFLFLMFLDII